MFNVLVIVALVGSLAALLVGSPLAYRLYLDRVEDWNPWAAPRAGRHRLGRVAEPYRPSLPVAEAVQEGEIHELVSAAS